MSSFYKATALALQKLSRFASVGYRLCIKLKMSFLFFSVVAHAKFHHALHFLHGLLPVIWQMFKWAVLNRLEVSSSFISSLV